jgi:uncharacterized protein YdcH (DUF465 family)
MEQHDLHHEFPEYRDQIHALKVSNGHFARLFDEYHDVNRHVVRVESMSSWQPTSSSKT